MAIQVIDWLNENALRAYPLQESVVRTADSEYVLTDDVILDAQFTFATNTSQVQLTNIVVDTNNVTFNTSTLTFIAAKASTFPLSVRTNTGQLLTIGIGCLNIPVGTHNFSSAPFETSTIFEFGTEWLGVQSIQFQSSSPLTGDLIFHDGYQLSVSSALQNINFACSRLDGIPIGCTSLSDFPNDCDAIVSFVNGVAAGGDFILNLLAGEGVVVLDDPDNHRIFVGLASAPTDICKNIPVNPAL